VLSVDYTAAMLTANETFDDKDGSGGIARIYGTFDLFNVQNGTLVYKFEHRHAYGSVSPFDFSLGQIGYVGLQEPPFNDTDFRTQNLYWRQRMNDGRSVLIAGILDVTDYLDAFALASPWLHFMNFAFSTGSATIGLPNDGALGVAFGTMLTDKFYLIAGFTDTNGDPSDPFEGFDSFFSDNEYFKSIEIGYTSSQERIILDNYHLTFWHKDAQTAANIPSGWGVNFSASRYLNENFMPFLRGGFTEDAGSLLEASVSGGVGYQTEAFDGLLGAAVNWGPARARSVLPGIRRQAGRIDDRPAVHQRPGHQSLRKLDLDVQPEGTRRVLTFPVRHYQEHTNEAPSFSGNRFVAAGAAPAGRGSRARAGRL
jgi:porin